MSGLFRKRNGGQPEGETVIGKSKSSSKGDDPSRVASLEEGATLIARNTRLLGSVNFSDQLYVNGTVEGDITAAGDDSTVVVCDSGVVKGEIRAPNVVIDGLVEGDVFASARVELAARARVVGDVHYNLVEMQLGSVVNGQMVSLADEVSEAKLVKSASAPLDVASTVQDAEGAG